MKDENGTDIAGVPDHRTFVRNLPAELRERLTTRSDARGLIHLAGHAGAIAVVSVLIAAQVPLWALLLPVQGILLAFLFTLAHECTHQTPFASRRLNEAVGYVCGVILILPFRWFRAYHLAHHRWTNLDGLDPELDAPKPETLAAWLWHGSGLPAVAGAAKLVWRLCLGREEAVWLAPGARRAAEREARVLALIHGAGAVSLLFSPLLFWLWIVPMLLGQPFLRLYLLAEHGDCPHVAAMFANTRTTYTTPLVRLLAWNMPYHTEHHVWPQVPFHHLPAVHDHMKAHLRVTSGGYAAFNRAYLARRIP